MLVGYGNRINDFNNRVHSVVNLGTSQKLGVSTFGSTDMFRSYSGLSVVDGASNMASIWIFRLNGPEIHLDFSGNGVDTT